jgi:hypothetical protein
VGRPGGCLYILYRCAGSSVGDIFADGAAEQCRILRNNGDGATELRQPQ